ncbi:DUF2905 domain-containing protein [Xylanibacillus composti]|uniref:Membrane protein n=1 Tax=Xylanibacillus composti TaxID=1572762 RepID=A0A8J4H3E1_9BACL|nr:DUF2905 domain-containing protein [Xylanibacillus composti]MDT9724945.1 DUF2905 domain-containing protein [Xylanibacillus composti]GIQ68184.1 membrane protein [Xylanibacillus composti]
MNMSKLLIFAGIGLIVIGLLWPFASKFLHLGRLPGDIAIKKEGFSFYFPIVTCLVLSVVLSLVTYVIRWFMK